MWRVVVHVKREGEEGCDLEVPAEVPISELVKLISQALGWCDRYGVKAESLGRTLKPDETLAEAGAWDGSHLIFLPTLQELPPGEFKPAFLISDEGREYVLNYPEMRIGRSLAKDTPSSPKDLLDLKNEPQGRTVSRHHARITFTGGMWSLTPLAGTKNQTLVNNKPADATQPCPLSEGDWLQFGGVRMRFRLKSAQPK